MKFLAANLRPWKEAFQAPGRQTLSNPNTATQVGHNQTSPKPLLDPRRQFRDLMIFWNDFPRMIVSYCEGKDIEDGATPDWYVYLQYLQYMDEELRVYLFQDKTSAIVPKIQIKIH